LNFRPKTPIMPQKPNNALKNEENYVKINCQKMQNKFSYSHSKVHVTDLWLGEHRTATSRKKLKLHQNPSPSNHIIFVAVYVSLCPIVF